MKWKIIIIILVISSSCKDSKNDSGKSSYANQAPVDKLAIRKPDSLSFKDFGIQIQPSQISYSTSKSNIATLKTDLKKQLINKSISQDSIQFIFTENLLNTIIPYWYGTPWSFEGHTAKPNQGEIACGYFVSTTLRDMGLQLNRYKLAQKSPIDEALVISCKSKIYTIEEETPEKAIQKLDTITSKGFYFIGFDVNHVGYLLKRKGKLFLIHSNYAFPNSVCVEYIENSDIFKSYSKFHITPISSNESLINSWLNNTKII